MSTLITQENQGTLTPGRGLRVLSTPGDPAGFVGVSGIHFNLTLQNGDQLFGISLASEAGGATYLSTIHGGLGSDAANPNSLPTSGFPAAYPAFPGPEVTGYYTSGPLMPNRKQNGIYNTEKVQRNASDAAGGANNATIQIGLQGRRSLNFSLWLAPPTFDQDFVFLTLYRDLNLQDKVAGVFGSGTGPTDSTNAIVVASFGAIGAVIEQPMPNLVSNGPFEIPAATSLYALFSCQSGSNGTLAIGDIWLS